MRPLTVVLLVLAGLLLVAVAAAAAWWWRRRAARAERPLVSIVLLLKEPRELSAAEVKRAVKAALQLDLDAEDKEQFLVGEPPTFCLKLRDHALLVNCVAHPYADDVKREAERIADVRLRQAFAAHRAWLSVDWLGEDVAPESPRVYGELGKLAAEFLDENCLVLYAPELERLNVPGEKTRAQLCGPDPLAAVRELEHPPLVEISGDDPRMKAAVATARARWPEFVAAFARQKPEQHFSVKVPLTEGEATEFIWIDVTQVDGEAITGALGNEPVNLKRVRLGQTVTVSLKDLNDWLYLDGGEMVGGFTVKVLTEAQERPKR